jgi:hypothetical protein
VHDTRGNPRAHGGLLAVTHWVSRS